MPVTVDKIAGVAASTLEAAGRALRRKVRIVRDEVRYLRAAEQAVARAFAGLRGESMPQRGRVKGSTGRDTR